MSYFIIFIILNNHVIVVQTCVDGTPSSHQIRQFSYPYGLCNPVWIYGRKINNMIYDMINICCAIILPDKGFVPPISTPVSLEQWYNTVVSSNDQELHSISLHIHNKCLNLIWFYKIYALKTALLNQLEARSFRK